jgi:hypothetical protein
MVKALLTENVREIPEHKHKFSLVVHSIFGVRGHNRSIRKNVARIKP